MALFKNRREYAQKNAEWLVAKAKEEGVISISKGECYKVLKAGNAQGRQPDVHSVITCHYIGKTIDGKVFDSSLGGVPLAIRLHDLIEGWIMALQRMHVGDKWE